MSDERIDGDQRDGWTRQPTDDLPDAAAADAGSPVVDDGAFEQAAPEDAGPDADWLDTEAPRAAVATGWQLPGPTGVQAVDEALAPLTELDEIPVADHVVYYDAAHRALQDALADLDGA